MARTGKISCLPAALREELNQRLQDGQLAPEILPWINGQPGVRERLAQRWPELPEITDGNLSEWRAGGFQDWLRDGKIRSLAIFAGRMAEASGEAPEALLRKVVAGRMLENLEALVAGTEDQEGGGLLDLAEAAAELSLAAQRETEHRDKTRQKDTDLGLRKIVVARKFVQFYDDAKARELAENARQDDAQLPLLADYLLGVPDLDRLRNS